MQRSLRAGLSCALVLALTVAAGCRSSTPSQPANPSIAGTWSGTYGTRTLTMTLAANAGSISGTGSIASGGTEIDVTVSGSHAHPAVTLHLVLVGYPNASYAGQFTDANTIAGIVTEPAGDFSLSFHRQ